mgnify:CR=1 FL=1
MVLTIDIGNTTIGIGGFQGNKLLFIEKISSRRPLSDAGYIEKLNMILNKHGLSAEAFEGSMISSVVPSVTAVFSSALETFLGRKPLILSHKLDLGCDRLADIAGAISRYSLPFVTIDLGTATTFNVLDENRRFLGGLILPGVGTAHRALLGKTAQLPKGDIHMPAHTIGANTQECITGGMLLGNACAIDGLIRRIQTELGQKATVVATGGYATTVIPHCETKIHIDQNLLMKGLRSIYENNTSTGSPD